jgi:hypothetical protein
VKRRWLLLGLLLGSPLSCQRAAPSVVQEAEFGVFFGGQVQQLKELKKELDPARQKHGFRVTFAGPLSRDVVVAWELSLPAADKNALRPALVGQVTAKSGSTLLDVPLAFRPQDPLGSWHAKVTVDGQVVVDRDFTVVKP